MFKIPSERNVEKCIITKESVEGSEEPQLIMSDDEPVKKPITKKSQKRRSDNEIA